MGQRVEAYKVFDMLFFLVTGQCEVFLLLLCWDQAQDLENTGHVVYQSHTLNPKL